MLDMFQVSTSIHRLPRFVPLKEFYEMQDKETRDRRGATEEGVVMVVVVVVVVAVGLRSLLWFQKFSAGE